MLTLRKKVIVSLLSMSLLTVVIGVVSAHYIMIDRFNNFVADRAMSGFLGEIAHYHETYGSWDAALEAESFFAFTRRNYSSVSRPPPQSDQRQSGQLQAEQTPSGQSQERQLPPRREPPSPGQVIPEAQRILGGLGAAAPPILVTDNEGVVKVPTPLTKVGDVISKRVLKGAIPLMSGETQIGYAISAQRAALSNLEIQYLSALKDSLWFSLLFIAVIVIPAGFILGRKLIAPIKNLSNAVVAMQPGSVHQIVTVTSNDELGQLSQSFNAMSAEMASFVQIIEQQKAKIIETEALRKEGMAGISHELRTPLNTCVAQANAMIDGIRPLDGEQMGLLSGSLDHLTKLVDDLFQLALADVNALECSEEVVDIATLTSDTIESRYTDFTNNGSEVTKQIPKRLEVVGDAKRLRQIIDNLLENCFRYANPGGEISVSLRQTEKFAELTVLDSGPGVSQDVLDCIFDRFYRADSSRDRNTGGTGLGLSLVKAWAEAQRGSADAFLSSEGGLGINVYIPLAKSGRYI